MISLQGVTVQYRVVRERKRTFQRHLINYLKGKRTQTEIFPALQDISLTIPKGETLGVIGHNGAGKSTLLKVIAGVLKPSEGSVSVHGAIAPLIELSAGFDMELTGRENIYLNASILGFHRRDIEKKIDAIIAFSELDDFIYSPLTTYSSGMISRLGFSVATEVDPDILIIDEILAVGDEHFRMKCRQKILSFKEKSTTILFVSHDMAEVKGLCDKVLWLDHGSANMLGNPGEVADIYLKSGG
jgi:ABC-type polysaccharide/polyol phosphate transport system ATPase subunit